MKAIILAAGQGTRLKKYTQDLPKGMLSFMGKTVIERQIEMFRKCGINDIIVIRGFAADKIQYEGIKYYMNEDFANTNMVESLMCAKEEFNDDEQIRLRNFCAMLNEHDNVKWMLSNADCSAKNPEDTFFEDIYADFYIHRVYASRAINANPEKRGKLTELLIKNYE